MSGLVKLVEVFSSLRVLVLGDAMLDVYLRGTSNRLCQEAPVPIVSLSHRHEAPGGACNTALNAAALGAHVTMLSAIGRDDEGNRLVEALQHSGVDCRGILVHGDRRTLCKQRIVAGSQLVARLDQGDTGPLPLRDQQSLAGRLGELWPHCDAVIVSDYDYGAIGSEVIRAIGVLEQRGPAVLVGDSKCLRRFAGVHFSAVKPNYSQAVQLLGACPVPEPRRIDQVLGWEAALRSAIDADAVAVTLDRDGAVVFERDRPPLRTYTRAGLQTRAAGAGDTYVAALALALAARAGVPASAEIAAAAAAIVVGRDGTTCCTQSALSDELAGREQADYRLAPLLPRLDEHRRRGQRIVLTGGCFDILHRGHITYLSQARALGDVLVVGLNSDASIARLKGPERPVNTLADRVQVLSALSCVDHVVAFDEDTPCQLVQAIRPDVFVKGGDYTRSRLPEAELVERLGGRVEILPLVRDRSTSSIISRIRRAAPEQPPPASPAAHTQLLVPAGAEVS
jgi:D-beta-D-heptose 7-phosphate kinase/D-beta-D-heptose 1-phosphate adenosyltransferase